MPTTTPNYLDLIHVDDEQNETAIHLEPSCYDELEDSDENGKETYDHPHAVPGRSTRKPYDRLNAGNTTYDQPDAGPALPDRPMPNQYQNVNQETTKPNTTHAYLELIDVDEDKNQTAEC